jgi:CDGSH-type Zn-finger protein
VSDDPATITPYRDGPYIVRGNFAVLDQDGNPIATDRRTIALCRCGMSQIRPFCDGTHKLIGFRAAGADERYTGTADGASSDDSPALNES